MLKYASAIWVAASLSGGCASDDEAPQPCARQTGHLCTGAAGTAGAAASPYSAPPVATDSSGAMTDGDHAAVGSGQALPPTGPTDSEDPAAGPNNMGGRSDDVSAHDCLAGIDPSIYASAGPLSYVERSHGSVTVFVPDVPAGCRVPVVHYANGTNGTCADNESILTHLASHGFVAACYRSGKTGAGTQCIEAVETVLEQHADVADETRVGFTGHSQGGRSAILCAYNAEQSWGDARTLAVQAIEPSHWYGEGPRDYASLYAQIATPIFMFNGSRDTLVSASRVRDGFDALDGDLEAYWYEAIGASHVSPKPHEGWSNESAVAWFRWKLLGDMAACGHFAALPNTNEWKLMDSQNTHPCQ